MHDVKDICARPDFYKERLGLRGVDSKTIDTIVRLYKSEVKRKVEIEDLNAEINRTSTEIADTKREGKDCTELLKYASILKELLPIAERGELESFIEDLKVDNDVPKEMINSGN
jgi:seryl-tRNA synthetase